MLDELSMSATAIQQFLSWLHATTTVIISVCMSVTQLHSGSKCLSFEEVTFSRRHSHMTSATLDVTAFGTDEMLTRPCVDCGLYTGNFCDYCLASTRDPGAEWAPYQQTPLCTACDHARDACHYCLGFKWCAPPPWRPTVSHVNLGRWEPSPCDFDVDLNSPAHSLTVPIVLQTLVLVSYENKYWMSCLRHRPQYCNCWVDVTRRPPTC